MNFNAEKMHRMCLKKCKFRSENAAQKMAEKCTEKYEIEHRVYWCALCGFWHLTTKEKWRKKNDNSV